MIAGAPLVFALDQVETTIEANSPELLKRIIVQACHVAEAIPSTAVIFSMLTGTFEHDVKPGLSTSLQDRLRNRPNPIMTLEAPSKETQRQVVELRCRELFRRSGLQYDAGDQYRLFPEWLVERGPAHTIRDLFQHIRRYRNACRDADDFVTEEQFESHLTGDIEKPVLDDFDKLWEDAKTAESKAVHVSDYERAKDFRWLAEEVAVEMPYVAKTEVEAQDSPETAARVLTVSFFDTDGELFERRMVGFLDEPNSRTTAAENLQSATASTSTTFLRACLSIHSDCRPGARAVPKPFIMSWIWSGFFSLASISASSRRHFYETPSSRPTKDWTSRCESGSIRNRRQLRASARSLTSSRRTATERQRRFSIGWPSSIFSTFCRATR